MGERGEFQSQCEKKKTLWVWHPAQLSPSCQSCMSALASPSACRESWAYRGHFWWEFICQDPPATGGLESTPWIKWRHVPHTFAGVTRREWQGDFSNQSAIVVSLTDAINSFSVLCLPVEDSASSLVGSGVFYELLVVSGSPNRSFSQFYRFFFPLYSSPVYKRNEPTCAALLGWRGVRKCRVHRFFPVE